MKKIEVDSRSNQKVLYKVLKLLREAKIIPTFHIRSNTGELLTEDKEIKITSGHSSSKIYCMWGMYRIER